jgi:hypothetical protein
MASAPSTAARTTSWSLNGKTSLLMWRFHDLPGNHQHIAALQAGNGGKVP